MERCEDSGAPSVIERTAEAEHASRIGDCVALRPGSQGQPALVSALPEECR
jgi:hypothetical protein